MAQRGKRVNRNDNDLASCPGAIKRRKCRLGPAATGSSALPTATGPSEEEETMASSSQGGASWTPRPVSDIKISSIYNRSAAEAPAELFRKDLISAMKLPDSEPLSPNEYWVITDQWKQEWERGVQVPVNPDSLPEPKVTVTQTSPLKLQHGEFKLPKKFIRISRDDYFNPEDHHLSTTPSRAEKACAYDLDDTDIAWLEVFNGERAQTGQPPITESELEHVIEELEVRCWERIQTIVKNEEGLGIEYDENVICDVCRSPDSEEGNEMVFCDCCNICVHQACYGITSIPEGSWLCRTCSLSQRPDCVLCPNKGGAMKCTRSGQKWAHVSCALWIPEVSIGCVEKMEPITKISSIPQSRWALICVLCRERVGACIQCSIKTCKTAYHVTCAFKYGLEMKAIIEDELADDGVKLRSYCQKHSRTNTKDKVGVGGNVGNNGGNGGSDSEDGESRKRKRKDMTSEEKNQARAAKYVTPAKRTRVLNCSIRKNKLLQEIEAEFDKHVSLKDVISQQLDIDTDAIVYIYNYWKLKRRAGHNKPLLAPRCGELSSAGARAQGQAADLEKMRTFVQLRQDLERVRNLCYMVGRREKLCRTFLRLREQTFHKQSLILSGPPLPSSVIASVLAANHGPSVYDRVYSHPESEVYTDDIETLMAKIAGVRSPTPVTSNDKKVQPDFNGASNKKIYFNGSVRKKSLYGSDLSSMSSSEPDVIKSTVKTPNKCSSKSKNCKIESDSSTEDEERINSSKSKTTARRKAKKSSSGVVQDRTHSLLHESSESDKLDTVNNRSRTLQHMEKELGSATGSESDELLTLNTNSATRLGPSAASAIYSDTDSDSQEHASHSAVLITKAAVKEFSAGDILKKNFTCKDSNLDDSIKNKENVKSMKKKEYPSALIVPQRQAAKKASEIMQRSQGKRDNLTTESVEFAKSPGEETKSIKQQQPKEKSSSKKQKDNKMSKDQTKTNDVYDFDKEFGDGMEILAYVPQRQAAKKAAEHIKSGLGTKIVQPDAETLDVKPKKDSPDNGKKKESKKEENKKEESPKKEEIVRKETTTTTTTTKEDPSKKSKKLLEFKHLSSSVLSSNSDSSSSSSCSSSSESSSDTDDSKSPVQHNRSSVKDQASSSNTSSESDTGNQSKSKALVKRSFVKSVDEPIDSDKKKTIGRKLKKLPDKKLKTSDGRHGPEFQPPSIEREESSGTTTSISKEQHQQPQQQQQQQQQSEELQQQTVNKKSDQRESSKKSGILQPQLPTDQNLFSGSRNNDGSRNLSGSKSVKKSNQIVKQSEQQQQQQPPSKIKEDNSTGSSRTKSDTRKRKLNDILPSKDDKNVKETSSFKKSEKKLTDKPTNKEIVDKDINKDNSKTVAVDSVKCIESTLKTDDKKIKKPSNKNAANTLEEEMKQRRAERDSPKKSLKGLDKLLEKREHMDKLSKNKNTEVKLEKAISNEQSNTKGSVQDKLLINDTIKSEDHKNHISENKMIVDKPKSEEMSIKNDGTEITHDKFSDRKSKSEDKIETMPSTDSCEPRLAAIEESSMTKEGRDDAFSKPTLDKIAVPENVEKEVNKRKRSTNRSIFSPQHGSKDPSVNEFFDFDQDMLTDEIVNDDGFNIPRDAEERSGPLMFSFNNELWFKDDSKEESARETMHLVEKLRMELSKKSNPSQFELEPATVEEDIKKEEAQADKTLDQIPEENEVKILETETAPMQEMKNTTEELARTSDDIACKNHATEEKRKLCYTNNSDHYVPYNNEDLETSKVTVVERAKLDRAEADERWVPPSIENFSSADVHLNALIDNQNHRYGNHQFTNDITNVLPESNPDVLVHSQLNMNMQEQYLLQQTHSMVRAAQHLESHAENRAQTMAVMDQQVTGMSTQMVDEITPMEMVNRHLIGLPNSEDDQGSEMDRVLEKEEMSSDMRQDYVQNGSPYNEMNPSRQDTRWAESQVLPSRRSTSSSITSASSGEDHTAIPPYKNITPMPFPACSAMDAPAYHAYSEANSYAGPVSLFPPQPCSAPLPYPSPGTAMFPPPFGAPFPTPQSLLSHVPKPLEDSLNMQASPCTAAFTSSSHNMALTAAMVSPTKVPTPPPQSAQPSLETEHEPPQLQQDTNVSVMPPMIPSFLDGTTTTVTATAAVVTTATTITTTSASMSTAMSTTMSPTPMATVTTASTTLTSTVQVSEAAAAAVVAVENTQEVQVDCKTVTVPQQSGKKSPSKPTRTSARVTSLQGKSPGKSPRHGETIKSTSVSSTGARGRGRGGKSGQQQQSSYRNRGRGRGRGRGRNNQTSTIMLSTFPSNAMHNDDSIQNKLVGTVYDFDSDEDSTNETNIADLRTMRERKKSTDIGGEKRGAEGSLLMTNDGIHQSRLSSPSTLHKKYSDDKRLSSPAMHDANVASSGVVAGAGGSGAVSVSAVVGNVTAAAAAIAESESNAGQVFADTVLPLLPGPVDMRTYNSNVDAPSSSLSHSQSYANHFLNSLAAGVSTDSVLPDIEEDIDKELQSSLIAGSKQQVDPSSKINYNNPSIDTVMASSSNFKETSKVSLSESRNQLKVKIKGPFLDANYVPASSVPPLAQQAPVIITPAATSASVASGTSNLRRMRKKELLRQYCSQDMNMDGDPACGNATSAPIILPPVNRTVITIPKAVASMTSIPTREDYKAVVDANMEKKRRKERGSFLDTVDEEGVSDRRRGGGSGAGGMVFTGSADRSRRGRQPKTSVTTMSSMSGSASGAAAAAAAAAAAVAATGGNTTGASATGVVAPTAASVAATATAATAATATTVTTNNTGPPKLKIKIGNSIIGQEMGNVQQDDRTRIRPPKKRLSSIPTTPSIEELRRESMKFRRMIMAGFDNDDDETTKGKSKKDRNGKRKKRQSSKKEARVQILEGGASTPKLIIRIGKSTSNSTSNEFREPSNDISSFLSSGIDVAERGGRGGDSKNAEYEARIGVPPAAEPSKEEHTYPMDSVIDDKQPTDSNTSATALRNVRSAKVTPIRLKLTRCQEGYELKDPVASSSSSASDDSALVNSSLSLTTSSSSSSELTCNDSRSGKHTDNKQSSKEDDIPLLSQNATHNSSGCPPAPLPQGCQVR